MKKYFTFAVIFALISFHFYSNYIFLIKGPDYKGIDVINHLIHKVDFHNYITGILSGQLTLKERVSQFLYFKAGGGISPPMIYLVSFLVSSIFGESTFVTEMSNIIYVTILILGVYFLGKKIANRNTGLLAAFIISCSWVVWVWSKKYGLDLPLMSLTPWVTISLLATDGFRKTKNSLFFGLILAFAILFKLQMALFIFAPLLYVLLTASGDRSVRLPGLPQITNLIISLGLAAFIISFFLKGGLQNISFSFFNAIRYKETKTYYIPPCPVFSGAGFSYYLKALMLGPFFLVLLFLAIGYSFFKEENEHARDILLLWIIFPYLFLTFLVCKWARWYFPSLPAMALLISWEVNRIQIRNLKHLLVVLILIFGLINLRTSIFIPLRYRYNYAYVDGTNKLFGLIEKEIGSRKNMKIALAVFNGERIIYIDESVPNGRALIIDYNIKLHNPKIRVEFLKESEITEADFIVLLLDYTPKETILELDQNIVLLENNEVPDSERIKMLRKNKYELQNTKIRFEKIPMIQRFRDWLYSIGYPKDYFFTPQVKIYYIFQIKKGAMTVEQCAKLLELPVQEVASWLNTYNVGGIEALRSDFRNKLLPFFEAYAKHYAKQLDQALAPFLDVFTIAEKEKTLDCDAIFLLKSTKNLI